MSPTTIEADEPRKILLIAAGRQRVGKTTFLNTTAQFLRAHGAEFILWNADKMNRTYSLSNFHPDVLEPSSADAEDGKAWLEGRFTDMVVNKYNALLDIGGGETPLNRLVEEVAIVRTLERRGHRILLAHVVGPEMADLDYLERFLAGGLFAPQATLIVLNQGLVLNGRSASFAFGAVRQHPALMEAMKKGAKMVMMPSLACMSQVTDRGLTFADAMNGVSKPGTQPLSFFDQERVATWWENELPPFYGMIPRLWLPAMPGFEPPILKQADQAQPGSGKKRSGTDG